MNTEWINDSSNVQICFVGDVVCQTDLCQDRRKERLNYIYSSNSLFCFVLELSVRTHLPDLELQEKQSFSQRCKFDRVRMLVPEGSQGVSLLLLKFIPIPRICRT